jgi:hypothetical protein
MIMWGVSVCLTDFEHWEVVQACYLLANAILTHTCMRHAPRIDDTLA